MRPVDWENMKDLNYCYLMRKLNVTTFIQLFLNYSKTTFIRSEIGSKSERESPLGLSLIPLLPIPPAGGPSPLNPPKSLSGYIPFVGFFISFVSRINVISFVIFSPELNRRGILNS